MGNGTHCLALDFGASSIRLVDISLANGRLSLDELARFAHAPRQQGGHLIWDYPAIYGQVETALAAAAVSGRSYRSIGAASWGVDYVLLDDDGALIAPPVSYRDGRTDGQVERFTTQHISAALLFEKTGLSALPFNTLYQLYAQSQDEPELLRRAHRLLFTADYTHFWLGGVAGVETTLASTSQMLTLDGSWWDEALATLALQRSALLRPVPAGTMLGELSRRLQKRTGLPGIKVIAPAAHDTQSAILAVPADEGGNWAYLSSGTWSILGTESPVPYCTTEAREAGLGNERGYGGTYCVQFTVTGLWLVQEIQRLLADADAAGLAAEAGRADAFRSLIDPADARFFHPADMIAEIRAACREAGEPVPETPAQLIRCAYESLALLYRKRLRLLSDVTGRRFTRLHVVGGGSNAMMLNRLCAATTGLPVLAGPTEATAIGNALAQLIALGELSDVSQARRAVRLSFPPIAVEPQRLPGLDNALARFERLSTLRRQEPC